LFRQTQPAEKQVRVDVSQEQGALKKQHCGRPNGWTASKPGQDKLADQRLHLKEQKSAYENRES